METKELKNIPESDVQEVVDDFEDEGCTIKERKQQADGRWTVVAECPEE